MDSFLCVKKWWSQGTIFQPGSQGRNSSAPIACPGRMHSPEQMDYEVTGCETNKGLLSCKHPLLGTLLVVRMDGESQCLCEVQWTCLAVSTAMLS